MARPSRNQAHYFAAAALRAQTRGNTGLAAAINALPYDAVNDVREYAALTDPVADAIAAAEHGEPYVVPAEPDDEDE